MAGEVNWKIPTSVARSYALQGLAAARPAATPQNQGMYYYATDTSILYQSWNGSWGTVVPTQNSIVQANGGIQLSGDSALPGAAHYYGTSTTSGTKGWYPLPSGAIPTAPSNLVATPGTTQVELAWSNGSGVSTNVYQNTSNNFNTATLDTNTASSNYTVTGLTNGTPYYFWLTSVSSTGQQSTATASGAVTPLLTAPKLLWKFDDGTGSSASDATGNGHTGSLIGPPSWSGVIPTVSIPDTNSLLFTTSFNEYVQVTPFNTSDTAGSITVWFKNLGAAIANLIWSISNNTALTTFIGLEYRGDDNKEFQIYVLNGGSGLNAITPNNTVTDTGWHHAAVTSDGSTVKVYIDGNLQTLSIQTGSNTGQWLASISGINQWTVGALIRSSSNVYFQGNLDEYRYYNYALTATQVGYLAGGYNQDGGTTSY
jgi:hypothetical protein